MKNAQVSLFQDREGFVEMRFLKALAAAVVVLVVTTALSHFVLGGSIIPQMAGFAGAIAGMVTWWIS